MNKFLFMSDYKNNRLTKKQNGKRLKPILKKTNKSKQAQITKIIINILSNFNNNIQHKNWFKVVHTIGDGNCFYHALLMNIIKHYPNTFGSNSYILKYQYIDSNKKRKYSNDLKKLLLKNAYRFKHIINEIGDYDSMIKRLNSNAWAETEEIYLASNIFDMSFFIYLNGYPLKHKWWIIHPNTKIKSMKFCFIENIHQLHYQMLDIKYI